MRIIRVFPRRTAATPDDEMAFVGSPPLPGLMPEADEVHVSVSFSWDIPEAERLVREWRQFYPVVRIGGPALGDSGGEFVPGRYLKEGYLITSRGCPNYCWFCDVPKREGSIRELPIRDGWNVLDSNLLACSDDHIERVLEMLRRQSRRPRFTGGIEPLRVTQKNAKLLASVRPDGLFCAYDTPNDLEPLKQAGAFFMEAGLKRKHPLQCYVLCGWENDTERAAEIRMRQAWDAGFMPFAMAWRDKNGVPSPSWLKFQRKWTRPAIITSLIEEVEE